MKQVKACNLLVSSFGQSNTAILWVAPEESTSTGGFRETKMQLPIKQVAIPLNQTTFGTWS